jgi:hypothetical protein
MLHKYKKNDDISLVSDMKYILESYRIWVKTNFIKVIMKLRKAILSRKKNKQLYYLALSKNEKNFNK